MIIDFCKNVKKYISYIMKVDFKEFFINVIEILLLVLLACVIDIPVIFVRDILYEIISMIGTMGESFYNLYYLMFTIFGALLTILGFIYMFNKRYSDIDVIRNKHSKVKVIRNGNEDIEMPKIKD